MAKPLRPKRGTTAQNDAFTGLESEITIDKEKHSIRVHDGVTAGGHEILPKAKNDELYEAKGVALPKTGGTVTGTISVDASVTNAMRTTTDSSFTQICGGTGYSNGAILALYGKDNGGGFVVRANDGTNVCPLDGKPDGTLKWGGNNVITSAGGTFTGDIVVNGASLKGAHDYGVVVVRGGSAYQKGAQISIYGKDHESFSGQVHLITYDKNGNQKTGYFYPNGSFTWDGKEVERVNSSSVADESGWIRYENGLQLCWGLAIVPGGSTHKQFTFPVAFTSKPVVTGSHKGSSIQIVRFSSITTTYFDGYMTATGNTANSGNAGFYWLAMGFWK